MSCGGTGSQPFLVESLGIRYTIEKFVTRAIDLSAQLQHLAAFASTWPESRPG
jgi:hypothetical protein